MGKTTILNFKGLLTSSLYGFSKVRFTKKTLLDFNRVYGLKTRSGLFLLGPLIDLREINQEQDIANKRNKFKIIFEGGGGR